jgi:hypothetical protein
VRRNRTTISALAAADSPVTLIRPALSRRWEAARVKAGNRSTSAKISRTNGKSIAIHFNSRAGKTAEALPLAILTLDH